jgi:DNA-directed RNA polymerase specialized sigma subunit
MKTRHHVAVQMEEERQWQKDNGPIVKTADELWKYSGETEKDSTKLIEEDIEQKERIVLLDNNIYSVLSEKRSRILAYWLSHLDTPMKDIAEIVGCQPATVTRTVAKYLTKFKEIRNK